MDNEFNGYKKYLKYKNKYLKLKQNGGNKKNIGIYVGRFQPLHQAHLDIIMKGLMNEDHMIVFIGSANLSDEKNPYSVKTREDFIKSAVRSINQDCMHKLTIVPIDNTVNYDDWFVNLSDKIIDILNKIFCLDLVDCATKENYQEKYNLFLYGSKKDASTASYIDHILDKSIVKFNKLSEPIKFGETTVHATDIRKMVTENKSNEIKLSPLIINPSVSSIIRDEKAKYEMRQPELKKIKILTFIKKSTELNNLEKARLFELYKITYEKIESDTKRIMTIDNIIKLYNDVVYFVKNNKIFGALFSTKNRYANKISIIAHDGEKYSKQYIYDLLNKLISTKGYIIEVSEGPYNILKNWYHSCPLDITYVKKIFGSENITTYPDDDKKYDRKTANHIISGKYLFGSFCSNDKDLSKSWSDVVALNPDIAKGCDLLFDDIKYESYNTIFENVFDAKAKMTYLADDFAPYNNLDSEAIIMNMVNEKICVINDIPDTNNFTLDNNGFSFFNIVDMESAYPALADSPKNIKKLLESIKEKMVLDKNYILNDESDRSNFRTCLENFCTEFFRSSPLINDELKTFETLVCLDAVPRDTNPENASSRFKAINLVHSDIYPEAAMGDVAWSFRNTWYNKLATKITDIETENLGDVKNRSKWGNKIMGIFNFWISLTDGMTDNGLAVLDVKKEDQGNLIPYKAFRPASRQASNVNFISCSLTHNPEDKWYSKYNMGFGDCYLFNTIGSPHSGFSYQNGSNKSRKSIELRIMLLKNVNTVRTVQVHREQDMPDSGPGLPGDEVVIGDAPN